MTAIGGSIEAVTLNGRIFPVAADAEANRKRGGWENEVEANGDGSARLIKTRMPLEISGLTIEIDDDRADQEYLQGLADLTDFFAIDITYASGSTWQGRAQLTGELAASSKNAVMPINLKGPGQLTQQ